MSKQSPPLQTVSAAEARHEFTELLGQVTRQGGRVLVEERGVPVAAIISAQDLVQLNRLEQEREQDFDILDELGSAFVDVPAEAIEREVAKAVAEVRRAPVEPVGRLAAERA